MYTADEGRRVISAHHLEIRPLPPPPFFFFADEGRRVISALNLEILVLSRFSYEAFSPWEDFKASVQVRSGISILQHWIFSIRFMFILIVP